MYQTRVAATQSRWHTVLPFLGGSSVVVLDLVSKLFVRSVAEPVVLIQGVVLKSLENTRGPFGSLPLSVTIIISVLVFVFLIYSCCRARLLLERIGFGLVIGGGISNFVERIVSGKTTDIVIFGNLSAWNLADLGIFVGVFLILLSWYRSRQLSFLRTKRQ